MKSNLAVIIITSIFISLSCSNKSLNKASDTATYIESDEDFPNPERGFYRASSTRTSSFQPLNPSELAGYRTSHSISRANYNVTSTLLFRYYAFDNFTDNAITEDILDKIDKDLAAVRQAGLKIIPRFVYTTRAVKGDCPEGFICPPYGDAPKSIILQHIAQLKPVLHKNADVIACVQMGFIGTWGEQYYSDHFGDPSSNGKQGNKLSTENWAERLTVLKALLDAVPKDRMVQVRYPQIIQKLMFGPEAPRDAKGLDPKEAFSGTDAARIGLHNDCFLSGPNDIGTYEDYGSSNTPRSSDSTVVTQYRNYMQERGKYAVIGGETCMDDYSPQNDCEPIGRAESEFAAMRYSYINANYNNQVNNDWQDGGCMNNIKLRLGYRFVLRETSVPQKIRRGGRGTVRIALTNKGFASPYNKRPVEVILRGLDNTGIYRQVITTEIQKWFPGDVNLNVSMNLPDDLPQGRYEVLLNLPDAYDSLAKRPEYSIRLANKDVWEEKTGYNKLLKTITVY